MNNKYCSKKGHHEGRLIEAICLRPECFDDRLLCFYCKHQNHRFHETAYFPKGLPASLQVLNKNSRIQNSEKQRRKIERKILSIKKGWQSVTQSMLLHIKQIQNSVTQSNETLSNTFLPDSVLQIKQKLSTEELPPSEVEKYVRMINRVNEFELNNHKKAMVYLKIKERFLQDVFAKAAFQVKNVMREFEEKSKVLNFTSEEFEKYFEEYFDEQNGIFKESECLIGQESLFSGEEQKMEFEKQFKTEFDETDSQVSELSLQQNDSGCEKQVQDQVLNKQIEQKADKGMASPSKGEDSLSRASSVQSSPSPVVKKFKIVIGNKNPQESCQNTNQKNEEIVDENVQDYADPNEVSCYQNQSTDRLQYRNIIKLKNNNPQSNRLQFQGFEPNQILCCRKMSLSRSHLSEDQEEEQEEKSLGKTNKKLKHNPENEVQSKIGQRRSIRKRMNNFFKQMLPNDNSSSDSDHESVQEKIKAPEKMLKPKNNAIYGSFDFSDIITPKTSQSKQQPPAPKNPKPQYQKITQMNQQISQQAQSTQSIFIEERYIQIHRRVIKLPENSHPQQHQSNFIYPNVKIYGHTLEEIYESLLMLDVNLVTKLQIYCDTTTLCIDTQCVDVIIKMKKLKSFMVYMTYQMNRTDVKKIIKNLSLLEELVLSEYNKMDQDLAKLVRDRLPNLRRFFYTIDERNYMQKIQENLEFFIDFKMTSTSLEVIEILADIPSLETIEIININNKVASRIPNVLQRMKNLKQVCIKNTNNSQSNSTDIVAYLASSNIKLEVFCAHNTTFKEESLVKIVEKNKNLHTLIINECLQLKNETMTVLSRNCPNLKQLSLMLIDSINGRQICTFTQLKTLVLRNFFNKQGGCWQIDHQFFLKNIHKLSELQFLSVSLNNYWFYDHFMNEVVKLSKLKFLNLDTTKVSDAGIRDLHKLKQLETLICGKTEVTFERLIKSLKGPYANSKNWTIRKLGLSKDEPYSKEVKTKALKNKHDLQITEFEAKNLIALGKALPGLTHLSIGGFVNPKKQYFETLSNLKCLFVTKKQLASETENWLVSKGVQINEDY